MKQNKQLDEQSKYNQAVQQAHARVFRYAKQLIATIERDDLRCYYERTETGTLTANIKHEIVTPLLYLQLYCEIGGLLTIRFGIEPALHYDAAADITSYFLRMLYRITDRTYTDINIERCVDTAWFINVCSEVYEYVDRGTSTYVLRKLPYKATPAKKQRVLQIV